MKELRNSLQASVPATNQPDAVALASVGRTAPDALWALNVPKARMLVPLMVTGMLLLLWGFALFHGKFGFLLVAGFATVVDGAAALYITLGKRRTWVAVHVASRELARWRGWNSPRVEKRYALQPDDSLGLTWSASKGRGGTTVWWRLAVNGPDSSLRFHIANGGSSDPSSDALGPFLEKALHLKLEAEDFPS